MLSATLGSSGVKCDRLSTEKVITGCDVLGDGEVKLSAVVVKVFRTPEVVVTLAGTGCLGPGILVNLEELARSVGSSRILNLTHVGQYGAPVSSAKTLFSAVAGVVLVHLDGNCVTGFEIALSFGGSGADIALQSFAGVVLNRAVGGRQTSTSALKILSVLPELLESGVGVGQRHDSGESCDGLHFVYGDVRVVMFVVSDWSTNDEKSDREGKK
jgi:hypothetical protein